MLLLKWGNKACILTRKQERISVIWGPSATFAMNRISSVARWVRTMASFQKLSSRETIQNDISPLTFMQKDTYYIGLKRRQWNDNEKAQCLTDYIFNVWQSKSRRNNQSRNLIVRVRCMWEPREGSDDYFWSRPGLDTLEKVVQVRFW